MVDELKIDSLSISRGKRAKALIEDPTIQGFYETYDQTLRKMFDEGPPEPDRLVRIHNLRTAGAAFMHQLTVYIAEGKLEERKLEEYANGE